ncbi:MAG: Cof-type HAD-IIB family hydrolase [Clostridiales bacterium]|nr:Cof-type HAD-IIB family hydrolase [Clostridiales bacterium]
MTKRTLNALLKAQEKGIKLAIATGRPMAFIKSVLRQVPFVDYVIYSNGACVFDMKKKKIIFSNLIDNKTAKSIVEYFSGEEVFFEIYVDGKSHYRLGTEEYFDDEKFPAEFLAEIVETMTAHGNLTEYIGDKDIEKIAIYSVKESCMKPYTEKLRSYNLTVVSSFDDSLEATVPTASKGNALKGLCETVGISRNEAMSFGDAGNDCSMLEYAQTSFAMGNASEECKKSAKYITASNTDDGVAETIEKYCL